MSDTNKRQSNKCLFKYGGGLTLHLDLVKGSNVHTLYL